MTRFTSGPAAGAILNLVRAPLFLRVVGSGGKWDALDQPADAPREGEAVHAYRRLSKDGTVHLDYTEKGTGRRRGVTLAMATYGHLAEQPADAVLRDNGLWRAWCLAAHAAEKGEGGR